MDNYNDIEIKRKIYFLYDNARYLFNEYYNKNMFNYNVEFTIEEKEDIQKELKKIEENINEIKEWI